MLDLDNLFIDSFRQPLQPLSCVALASFRKEKQLHFSKAIRKVSDLSTAQVSAGLGRLIGDLTEQSLFQIGGEMYEVAWSIQILQW